MAVWLGKDKLAETLSTHADRELLRDLRFRDAGHGYDVFGFDPTSFVIGLELGRFFHEHYFRVRNHGVENVPTSGGAILAANHSAFLPIDAVMIVTDIARNTHPPRVARAIGDVFIPLMPWIGSVFARMGMVSGTRANFRSLLQNGELVLVFPEGAPGIGKGFRCRYQLQAWRVGHAELAISYRVPIVPVAVIGAEEAWPQLARIDSVHAFGAPFLPVPLLPAPLPVRCDIHYGKPVNLYERWRPDQADDPSIAREAADLVRREVESLIARGLEERRARRR